MAHALLRYKSLEMLQFESINQKRACLLAQQHLAGQPLACARLCHQSYALANTLHPLLVPGEWYISFNMNLSQ